MTQRFNYSLLRPDALRVAGFLALEIIFVTVALLSANSPLSLGSISSSHEVTGAFNAAFVGWHFIATLLISDLLLAVFSEEWSFYLARRSFHPGCDAVSTLSASMFFHVRNFLTRPTSIAYKAAFLSFVLLVILRTLGPASISTTVFPFQKQENFPLATFTPTVIDLSDRNDPVALSIQRAEFFARAKYELGFDPGWKVDGNMLVRRPWAKALINPNVTMTFQDDVVHFDFQCSWAHPTSVEIGRDIRLRVGETEWKVWNFQQDINDIVQGIYPLVNASGTFSGLSAYLFVGCDDTATSNTCFLNMTGLPDISSTSLRQTHSNISLSPTTTMSTLICDPNINMTASSIVSSGTTLTIMAAPNTHPSQPSISRSIANLICSSALLHALANFRQTLGLKEKTFAERVFLYFKNQSPITETLGSSSVERTHTAEILDLDSIQQNMNEIMRSASQGFLQQPFGLDSGEFPGLKAVDTSATVQRPTTVLVGSRLFAVITTGLLFPLIICGCLILLGTRSHNRLPLDLKTILTVVKQKQERVSAPYHMLASDRPFGTLVSLTSSGLVSSTRSTSETASEEMTDRKRNVRQFYQGPKYVKVRATLFVVLQTLFYALATVGCVQPFAFPHITSARFDENFVDMKGGLLIAFAIFYTLSQALLNDIILTIFSLEWAVRAEKKLVLEPGLADEVSSLTSGLFGQIKFATMRNEGASSMFRYALASFISLMLLAVTGPGCFTLLTETVAKEDAKFGLGIPSAIFHLDSLLRIKPINLEQMKLLSRIATITHLEQLEGFTWGYRLPSNIYTPWPYGDARARVPEGISAKYDNYVISYKTECRWEYPFADTLDVVQPYPAPIISGAVPVNFKNRNRTERGHWGILLVDDNSRNLDFNGVGRIRTDYNDLWNGTAGLLVCDPSTAGVKFSEDFLQDIPFQLECAGISLEQGLVEIKKKQCDGGIPGFDLPRQQMGRMFSSALLFALQPPPFNVGNPSGQSDVGIGLLTGQLLFSNFTKTLSTNMPRSVAQIHIPEVEARIDDYLSSALKLYMAGYDPILDKPLSELPFNVTDTSPGHGVLGTILRTADQVTLVGNKGMIISSLALMVFALQNLRLSLHSLYRKQSRIKVLEPFGIASVTRMQKSLETWAMLREGMGVQR